MNVERQPIVILIADDDEEDQMLTREAFEDRRLANELRFVKNGEEVMQYLKRQGRFAEIKADPALASIPVSVLTTSREEEAVHQTYEHGGSSLISKPIDFDAFMELVTTVTGYRVEIITGA